MTQRHPLPPAAKLHPPRPNKLFLIIATILLVAWTSFLAVLAVIVRF